MPNSLQFSIQNNTETDEVYAYVSGIAIKQAGQRCLLKANKKDFYFPTNPPSIGSPLTEDCAIPLGPPGSTTTLEIPQIAGGRLWFSRGGKLTFLLNPGPALVEPSVLNPSDPNANLDFAFAEFTLDDAQFYANISYVDFVPRLPVGIALDTRSGATQTAAGMPSDGLEKMATDLGSQARKDGQPWDKLVVVDADGKPLRALNPTHGNAVGADFASYFASYVARVWDKYAATDVQINTQAGPGVLRGRVRAGKLRVGDQDFDKPSSCDIWGCNSGPFATGPSAVRNAIIPRLAAAFVRTTLLDADAHPSPPDGFYRGEVTNHYARIVHQRNLDRKGYAFAYDDVQPDEGEDQSGKINAGDPVLFRVSVGGPAACADRVEAWSGAGAAGPRAVQGQDRAHERMRDKLGGFMHKVLH